MNHLEAVITDMANTHSYLNEVLLVDHFIIMIFPPTHTHTHTEIFPQPLFMRYLSGTFLEFRTELQFPDSRVSGAQLSLLPAV